MLDHDSAQLFKALLAGSATPGTVRSTREQRAVVRAVTASLEAAGFKDARHKADILVQLQAQDQLEAYLPLLRHAQCELILDTAHSFGAITSSTVNINTAVDRVAKIVFALKAFSRFDQANAMVEADLRDGIETITVHSVVGSGTTFRVYLPYTTAHA